MFIGIDLVNYVLVKYMIFVFLNLELLVILVKFLDKFCMFSKMIVKDDFVKFWLLCKKRGIFISVLDIFLFVYIFFLIVVFVYVEMLRFCFDVILFKVIYVCLVENILFKLIIILLVVMFCILCVVYV